MSMADRVAELNDEAGAGGHFLSAAEKYGRATAYYVIAEHMQSRHYAPRTQAYRTMLKTIERSLWPVRSIASVWRYHTGRRHAAVRRVL
jgi:hypothetical protein